MVSRSTNIIGEQMAQIKVAQRIDKYSILSLLGGSWPAAHGLNWRLVDHFRLTSSETIQGYTEAGEPLGPAFEYKFTQLAM